MIDPDEFKSSHDPLKIKSHEHKPINHVLVVAVISAEVSVTLALTIRQGTYLATLSASSSALDLLSCCFFVCVADPPLPSPRSRFGAPAYLTDHSCATRSNSLGFRISIPATSASCGSLGSGVLRSDWRDKRADLTVKTGDQAEERVSRQMAP